uniref:DNA repair protein REV1 n=1 Tax=Acrobeloides nanus TaxID=290746 RepID=A0A914C310_9BILA
MDENSAFDDPDEPSTSTGITRKRVSDGPEIVLGEKGEFPNFGHYMDAKVQKLMHQVHSNVTKKSDLFNGISIFVNGYTLPPAAELKKIVVENGGEYHHYYKLGRTTYMIAMNLAKSKLDSLRKEEIVVHPKWIMNSLQQGLLLPIHPYLLTKQLELTQNVLRTHANPETSASRFYERSRLHLISTLAQEMKEYIAELRSKMDTHEFVSRSKLCHLSGSKGDHSAFICHLDMDCFFVSIGLRMRPDLVGKPLVITHSRSASDHGKAEIASCSYEARKFNIKNGMWISDAYNLCPDLVCLPYQFEEYRASSKRLYSIVSKYTLDIKAVSCDEMYVDLSGLCEELQIGDVMGVVNEIRKEIFDELNCNASAGIGPNMLIARLATKKAKPNGQFMVTSSEVSNFIRPVAIKDLPGVGYSSLHKIKEAFGNMMTCEELQSVFCSTLQALFGTKLGAKVEIIV